jgi:LysR family glycine cleavage system transcriptional activator
MAQRIPSLNWLRAFEVAARHLSFTEAAKEFGVTQGAISQQVKQLEDWLGQPLFHREGRKLSLSDAGMAYLPVVRRSLDQLTAGTEELFGGGHDGPINVRVTSSLTYVWLLPRIGRFMARHPGIALRLITDPDPGKFGEEGIDVAIRYGDGNWPDAEVERLFWEKLFPVCGPALLERGPPLRAPRDLAHHRIIHVVGEPENWQMWLHAAAVEGLVLDQGLQFDLHMMATHAAIAGVGVALGLSPMVDDALADGRLVRPFDIEIPARHAHYVVTPLTVASRPQVEAFRQWLLEEAARGMARGAQPGLAP